MYKRYEVLIVVHYRVEVQATDHETARERATTEWENSSPEERQYSESNFDTTVTERG